jgi:hypothetical protein
MRYGDGRADLTTRVIWAQTRSLYVDIRIPAKRPAWQGRRSFADFSLAELRGLANQQGFAGHVEMQGPVCTWLREFDYWPDRGRPDRGRLTLDGDLLTEEGDASTVIGADYREVYRREQSGDKRLALRLLEDRPAKAGTPAMTDAILVVLDDLFLFARPRATPLPKDATLPQLAAAAGRDRARLEALLDCEISLGRIGPARRPWRIELSTLPHREGQRLFPRAVPSISGKTQQIKLRSSARATRWRINDNTFRASDMRAMFGR